MTELNLLAQLLKMISPHYPVLIIGLIFIAVIVGLILTFWLFKALRRGLLKVKWPKRVPKSDDDLTQEQRQQKSWIFRFKKWFGLIQKPSQDEISLSFEMMRDTVQDLIGGIQPLYRMPLYLMIGSEDSGKREVLNQANLSSPFELDSLNPKVQLMRKYWWFFDQAVVFKAPGLSLVSKDSAQSDLQMWRQIVSLLERQRPERPLDGIILTIPCDELIGKGKLDKSVLYEKARVIYNKLSQLQTACGTNAPVYVVLTKADSIFGFESFCKEIPTSSLSEVFGWSNPYGTNQVYSSSFVDNGFDEIEARLNKIILEVYTENASLPEADGIYVFSRSFQDIKENLQIYLDEIFKNSGLHDPFIFRGFYFTGDSTISQGQLDSSREVNNIPRPELFSQNHKVTLCFLRELFGHKIFLESGIARPSQRSMKHNQNALNITKICLILLLAGGTVETFSLRHGLAEKKGAYLASLGKLQEIIQEADSLTARAEKGFDQDKFLSQGKFLVELINLYENTRFTSPLVPASWVSTSSDKLQNVLAISFDYLVLRSLSLDLKLKVNKILQGISLNEITGEFKSPGLNRSKMFVLFSNFVKDVDAFERAVGKYNEFSRAKDRKHLEPVVDYLLGAAVPKSFFAHISGQISETLKWGEYVPIELSIFESMIRDRFMQLMQVYLNSVLGNENFAVQKYEEFSKSLEMIGAEKNNTVVKIEDIQRLEIKAGESIDAINHNEFKWLANNKLQWTADLDDLVLKITNSKLLGKPFADELKKRAEVDFSRFKSDLTNLGMNLTGPVFKTDKGSVLPEAAESYVILRKSLEDLSRELFMMKTESKSEVPPITPGKVLIWDLKTLLQASNIVTSYDQFIQSKLGSYPAQIQASIQSIALKALQINVMNLLIKAVTMDNPYSPATKNMPEDTVKPIIENLKNALPHLSRILPILNADNVGNNFVALQNMISKQYYGTLSDLDGVLTNDGLYRVKDGNFNWWDGSDLVNAKAFNTSDEEDLKNYLKVQSERVLFLTKEFAIPLLTILKIPSLQMNQVNMPALSKWSRILDQVLGYEKKRPDSSLIVLENYILKDLSGVTIQNCGKKLKAIEAITLSGDFFTNTKQTIAKQIYDRCKSLTVQGAIKNYTKLATFFNNKLSNKFPFAESNITEEASADDVQTLYKIFTEAGGDADKIVALLPESESSIPNVRRFLKTLEELKDLFAGFIGDTPALKTPSYMLSVSFRVNQSREVGASSIVDWFFSVGGNTVTSRGKEKTISWNLGDPVMVSFKWAGGGTTKPSYDSAQPQMSVEDRLAAFSFTSRWALFRALQNFAATQGELGGGPDSSPHVLRFSIPTVDVPLGSATNSDAPAVQEGTPGETARVYLRVEVKATEKAGGQTIVLPQFPTGAPILSEGTRALGENTPTIKPVESDKKPEAN